MRQAKQGCKTDFAHAAFNATDLNGCKSGSFGKFFLRPAVGETCRSHVGAELLDRVHPTMLAGG